MAHLGRSGGRSVMRRPAVRLLPLIGSFLALVLIAGCQAEGGPTTASPTTASPTTTTTAPASPELYAGTVDGFYEVPDPLPGGEPGELIRIQEVGQADGATLLRVMYHSRDVQGDDRAVTGIISYPTTPAPEGGWPVVSWAHGTTGLASPCAPSRGGGAPPGFGVEGVHVATDYIGLGPVGERHSYLSGTSEANSVIDAVRAARKLPDADAGARWVAAGHSQGGHSALFTNELAGSYAPELDLLGTAAIAPATVVTRTFGPDDQVIPRMVGVMALYGWAADYPEIDPRDYVGPEVAAADAVVDEGCLDDVVSAFVGIPAETFYDDDPFTTEPAATVAQENDAGRVASESPLLLVSGTIDDFVVPARLDFLFDRLCGTDQVTERVVIEGADHGTVVSQASDEIGAWFAARLAGEPAPDACATE